MTVPDHAVADATSAQKQTLNWFTLVHTSRELVATSRALVRTSRELMATDWSLVAQSKRQVAGSGAALNESRRLLTTRGYEVSPRMPVLHDRWAVAARIVKALREVGFGCDAPKLPTLH